MKQLVSGFLSLVICLTSVTAFAAGGTVIIDGVPSCLEPEGYNGPENDLIETDQSTTDDVPVVNITPLTDDQTLSMSNLSTEGEQLFEQFIAYEAKYGITVKKTMVSGRKKTLSWRIRFTATNDESGLSDVDRWFMVYAHELDGELNIIILREYQNQMLADYKDRDCLTPRDISDPETVFAIYANRLF